MPSYMIHLAVAKKYLETHKEKDPCTFYAGVMAPDVLEKPASHFGSCSSEPGLSRFALEIGLDNSYKRGYFLHLVTDYLFYNKHLSGFSKEIYRDYDVINSQICQRYGICPPRSVAHVVKFIDGNTTFLDKDRLFEFIESFESIDLSDFTAIG